MYDLMIIGGGPAGVAGGIYASRKKLNTLLVTKDFGGQSLSSDNIENFVGIKSISGVNLSKNLEEHLRAQEGIEIKDGFLIEKIEKESDDSFILTDSKTNQYKTKTVLITLGSSYRKLDVPGEKEFSGKGVFYCSICDAPLMKGKNTVVVGGGNSGLEAVIDLLPYSEKIYLLVRSDKLKGDQIYQDQIKNEPKVQIIINAQVKEISGEQFVKNIKYIDLISNEEKNLEVSGVFVQIGYTPNSFLVKDLVEINKFGHIVVDQKTQKTSQLGIWAAGDITDGLYNQINTAIGDSIKAVLNVYDYLKLGK